MEKSIFNSLRALFFLGALFLVAGMAFGFVPPAAALSFVMGGGGLNGMNLATAGASATVIDTVTSDKVSGVSGASPDLLLADISQKITEMRRTKYPLDTILREIGLSEKLESYEAKFYYNDERGIEDTVALAFSTAGAGLKSVQVTNIHLWQVDDNAMVDGINGSDGYNVVLRVCDIDRSGSLIKVIAINGGTSGTPTNVVPNLPLNTKLYNIGNAKDETAAQTEPYSIAPLPQTNYAQIHMSQVEESVFMGMLKKEVQWDITNHKLAAVYDMKKRMELTSLFGVKGYTADAYSGKKIYTSNGITRLVGKNLTYTKTSALSDSDLIGWTESIFVGNQGADKRIMFTGAGLNSKLMGIPIFNKQLEAGNSEVVFGITFNRIETNYGQLLVKHHDLFNQAGWYDNGLVLDISNLEKHIMEPFNTTILDLNKSGQRRVNSYRMLETFCVVTRYPDTHAVIKGI